MTDTNELEHVDHMARALMNADERLDVIAEAIGLIARALTTTLTEGQFTDLAALANELSVDAEARAYFTAKAKT